MDRVNSAVPKFQLEMCPLYETKKAVRERWNRPEAAEAEIGCRWQQASEWSSSSWMLQTLHSLCRRAPIAYSLEQPAYATVPTACRLSHHNIDTYNMHIDTGHVGNCGNLHCESKNDPTSKCNFWCCIKQMRQLWCHSVKKTKFWPKICMNVKVRMLDSL